MQNKTDNSNRARLVLISALTIFLLGCAGVSNNGAAPVEERAQPPSQALRLHLVTRGESLYSIAFRYERDFRQLAAINGLAGDYTIHPGQKLYLTEDAARDAGVAATNNSTRVATVTRPSLQSSPNTAVDRAPSSSPAVSSAPNLPALDSDNWVWPQSGSIVRSFGSGDPASKGIQISAPEGSPVVSAIDGVVVYSGSGLRGYGNLLIIKHDESHLSAYAYNKELVAQEGDLVRTGQKIATVGFDAEGNSRLYFEIRLDGRAVDPIRYLPRR